MPPCSATVVLHRTACHAIASTLGCLGPLLGSTPDSARRQAGRYHELGCWAASFLMPPEPLLMHRATCAFRSASPRRITSVALRLPLHANTTPRPPWASCRLVLSAASRCASALLPLCRAPTASPCRVVLGQVVDPNTARPLSRAGPPGPATVWVVSCLGNSVVLWARLGKHNPSGHAYS